VASKKFRVKNGVETQNIDFVSADGSNTTSMSIDANGVISVSSSNNTFFVFDPVTTTNFSLSDANTAIDNRVTQTFINNLNVDASTLGDVPASDYALNSSLVNLSSNTITLDSVVEHKVAKLTTTDTLQQNLFSFSANTYSSVKANISVTNIGTGERQHTEYVLLSNLRKVDVHEKFNHYTRVSPEATFDVSIDTETEVITLKATSASSFERSYTASLEMYVSPVLNITIPEAAILDRSAEPIVDRQQEYILVRE